MTLVCFPHAGGSASFFHSLSAAVSGEVRVLAVQYPGRQDRHAQALIDDIGELADAVHAALSPWGDEPIAFFGHSMGATVAFEVVRRSEKYDGVSPLALFASGRRAPSRMRPDVLHKLDDESLLRDLGELEGTDARLLADDELVRMVLPVIRNDYKAIETYSCDAGAMITCPIVAMVGNSDPRVTADEANAWGEHTTGNFELRRYPGGHFYLVEQQSAVIDAITEVRAGLPMR
jgi:surfactin synthase thioesterase subunit